MSKSMQRLVPFIALAGGILFIILGIQNLRNSKTFLNAAGVISDIQVDYEAADDGNKYNVYVKYTVDGTEYESELGEYSSSMHIGDSIDILYNPVNPDVIMAASPFGSYMQLAMGIICLVAAAISGYRRLKCKDD